MGELIMMNPLILPPSNWWRTKSSENGVAMSSLVLHNSTIDTKHVHINGYYTRVPHEFLCENDTGALISALPRTGVAQGPLGSLVILADHRHWAEDFWGVHLKLGLKWKPYRGKKIGDFYWVDDVMIILEYSLLSVWDSDRDAYVTVCNCNIL